MDVVVGQDGVVQKATVQKGLGYGLDEESLDAVNRRRFEPAMMNGKPVNVRIQIQTKFRLYSSPQRTPSRPILKPRP
jgi:protein TonB